MSNESESLERLERCWLYDGCPCKTAGCIGLPDDGCPVYRWFEKIIKDKDEASD